MKAMTMGGAAIAAMLMMGAAPALAQKADPDALCVVAVEDLMGQLDAQRATIDPAEMQKTMKGLDGALIFYSGTLLARVPAAQLAPLFVAARAEYKTIAPAQRPDRAMACARALGPALRKIATAMGE
jgi:hypothetical protein